jgi:hypothetical protein
METSTDAVLNKKHLAFLVRFYNRGEIYHEFGGDVKDETGKRHGFLKVNFPFVSFIDGTRPDERRSVHHRGLFTPRFFSPPAYKA